ncbi:uncharacterized protein PADG_12026 [Paracoccidioides brasiliensis Pb18]|uniref:Extracellular membrane protein CFEM domain-containing protein n=2 Tax=Paracoccidioides brasiliensis TaxID=121759 RepID=A0A0A0HWV9_PARBD|nr:uncharacterized protein PADG_12026 [Paracoccidioides brasiliensis Pb18]KGM91885.1 hypothetical protein PADG_12026 [Paracoccidioides brasiliensis Pb18]ODH46019.1 hypothetical protein GX48_07901 [Paracoccidioides brasiliensis]
MKIDLSMALVLVLGFTAGIATAQGRRVDLCKEGFHCNKDIDCQADPDCQRKAEGMEPRMKTIAIYCHTLKRRCEVAELTLSQAWPLKN